MTTDAKVYESPEVAAAFFLWQSHMHPFTCGGGGGPCSGVSLELMAANPHAVAMRCPRCGRDQLEIGPDSLVSLVLDHANNHDPSDCFTCGAPSSESRDNR